MPVPFDLAARQIVAAGRWLDGKGWAPATSGNYSVRLDDGSYAVTVSGRHKGRLDEADVMRVDDAGRSLDGQRPSAETALHLQLYRLFPQVGAILHTHSVPSTALTRAVTGDGIRLTDYEMLKAFPGVGTHEAAVTIPVVDNDQDMAVLEAALAPALANAPPAYLIRAHGLYGWGADMAEAERVVEAAEWLLAAEWEQYKAGAHR